MIQSIRYSLRPLIQLRCKLSYLYLLYTRQDLLQVVLKFALVNLVWEYVKRISGSCSQNHYKLYVGEDQKENNCLNDWLP